jgi:excinuclease UvrABC nuclease subunit
LDYVDKKYDLRGKSFQARYGSVSKQEYQSLFDQMMTEVFTVGTPESSHVQDLRAEYEHAGILFESKYNKCRDVVAVGKKSGATDEVIVVHILQLRDRLIAGRFTYSCALPEGGDSEEDCADAIFTVLTTRHYTSGAESRGKFCWFPDSILLSHVPSDMKGLRSIIRELGKTAIPRKSSIRVAGAATRGDMVEVDKRTLELAEKNANQAAFEKSVGGMNIGIVDGSGAVELAKLVGCERTPSRIECYVSNGIISEI